jgi:hypothetical protein
MRRVVAAVEGTGVWAVTDQQALDARAIDDAIRLGYIVADGRTS